MSRNALRTESERIAQMFAEIRTNLPTGTAGLRNFFPKQLTEKLTRARLVFLQFKYRVPERSISLTGVLNLLDQMEKVHGGPFESLIGGDEKTKAKLKEMIGQFQDRPQESFSFALDRDSHHRLRMAAEFTGVHIRQIVATGMSNFLSELEKLYGHAFDERPYEKDSSGLTNIPAKQGARVAESVTQGRAVDLPSIPKAQPGIAHQTRTSDGAQSTRNNLLAVEAAQCPQCRDIIVSRWDHDLHGCNCGAIAVNGGPARRRVLWEEPNRPIYITVVISTWDELRASPGLWAADSTEPRRYRLVEGKLVVEPA